MREATAIASRGRAGQRACAGTWENGGHNILFWMKGKSLLSLGLQERKVVVDVYFIAQEMGTN